MQLAFHTAAADQLLPKRVSQDDWPDFTNKAFKENKKCTY
jgi:hypothetical protein